MGRGDLPSPENALTFLQFRNELCVVGVPSNAVAVGSTSRYTDAVTLDAQVILYHKRSPLCPVHLRGRLPRRLRTRGVEEPFSACSDNPAVECEACEDAPQLSAQPLQACR